MLIIDDFVFSYDFILILREEVNTGAFFLG